VISASARCQRTIVRSTDFEGIGFLTGAAVRLRFVPAPPNTGVVFVRTDLPEAPRIAAHVSAVTGTARRTTLGHPPAQVGLVEHVLAALAGLRIDNCLVELDAPEPPGLDGSAWGFVQALVRAGVCCQGALRPRLAVTAPIVLESRGTSLALYPADPGASGLTLTYFLDYGPGSPIARQSHTLDLNPGTFLRNLARSRTFLLADEARELRRQGLGSRTSVSDLVVFGPHGPIDNRLRWADEPARHKLLDIVGDLALLGADLDGRLVAYRSGHPLNVELARRLAQWGMGNGEWGIEGIPQSPVPIPHWGAA
jgi:UDP-3-O-acyl N-acetylglucosamine deacetylase